MVWGWLKSGSCVEGKGLMLLSGRLRGAGLEISVGHDSSSVL